MTVDSQAFNISLDTWFRIFCRLQVNTIECAMIQLHRLQPSLLTQYESFLASRLAIGCNGHLAATVAPAQEQTGRTTEVSGGSQPAQQGDLGAAATEKHCRPGATEQQHGRERGQGQQEGQGQQQQQQLQQEGQCDCDGTGVMEPIGSGVQLAEPQAGGGSCDDKWLSLWGRLQAQKKRLAALRGGDTG